MLGIYKILVLCQQFNKSESFLEGRKRRLKVKGQRLKGKG